MPGGWAGRARGDVDLGLARNASCSSAAGHLLDHQRPPEMSIGSQPRSRKRPVIVRDDCTRQGRNALGPGNLLRVETFLSVLQVAISVVLVLLVLMHSGKDSGLSGAFGVGSGTGPLGGGSLVERNLNRWTIFFAILFVVNAIVLLKRPWA
jgi:preprotein translocase subunit SecG